MTPSNSWNPILIGLMNDPERPIREPADLRHHTLLHEEIGPSVPFYVDWPKWLASAGVAEVVDASRGPRFSHTFLALKAAASGQGVALATSVLIGDALEAGRLVRPFSHELRGTLRVLPCLPRYDGRPASNPGISPVGPRAIRAPAGGACAVSGMP